MKRAPHDAGLLQQILTEMGADSRFERFPTTPIPKETVQHWMTSPEIEALGATYAFVSKPKYSRRIRPPLRFEEEYDFIRSYFDRCLIENPDGKWSHNRYEAGWDLVNWFALLWRDAGVPRSALADLREWMGKLYSDGDKSLRRCLVDATLEHLFEQSKIRRYFDDWRKDPILNVAYEEALDWVKGGGKTPLGKAERLKFLRGKVRSKRT